MKIRGLWISLFLVNRKIKLFGICFVFRVGFFFEVMVLVNEGLSIICIMIIISKFVLVFFCGLFWILFKDGLKKVVFVGFILKLELK